MQVPALQYIYEGQFLEPDRRREKGSSAADNDLASTSSISFPKSVSCDLTIVCNSSILASDFMHNSFPFHNHICHFEP